MTRFDITRDSVCMGDDVDAPHQVIMELDIPTESMHLIKNIIDVYPLAHVASRKVSWTCCVNNIYISEIIIKCDEEYENETVDIVLSGNEPIYHIDLNKVHFSYISDP